MAVIAEAIQSIVEDSDGFGDSGGVQRKFAEMRETLVDVETTSNNKLNCLLQQLRLVSDSLALGN